MNKITTIPEHIKQQLTRLSGTSSRDYATVDFGREQRPHNISVVIAKEKAYQVLPQVRSILPTGLVAFIGTTRWYGDERHHGVELVVGPGESQFDIIRLAESDAINYNLTTEAIITRLQQYNQSFGITILQAETDTIEFELINYPPNLMALAHKLYQFCPDIVNQGVGSVEALAESIEVTGRVTLWWD